VVGGGSLLSSRGTFSAPCWEHLSPEDQNEKIAELVREIEEAGEGGGLSGGGLSESLVRAAHVKSRTKRNDGTQGISGGEKCLIS
jgi:hypothetical protein